MPVFPRAADEEDMPDINRLLALTDGVVAIALTLLVLQLRVPELTSNMDSARALWHALDVDGGELTSYLIAFVVIAQFWLVHHRILRTMRGHSEGLAWRNFGFLLALTLMPFTSDLLGRYGSNPLAITFFAINLLALSLSTQWIYVYAIRHHLVVEKRRSSYQERLGRVRTGLTFAVVSIALVFAWTDAAVSRYVWLLFLVVPLLGSRIALRAEPEQPAQASAGG